jgi:hypothetical protein
LICLFLGKLPLLDIPHDLLRLPNQPLFAIKPERSRSSLSIITPQEGL